MVSFLFKVPRWWRYYSRKHGGALTIQEITTMPYHSRNRGSPYYSKNDGSDLIIQRNIATLLFKEFLRPCYSRNLCGVQEIAMLLIKFKDHCSVLVIQGITVVFQLFNRGVLIIQATTVSLLITTNYNT
jgi:hypothetical protein